MQGSARASRPMYVAACGIGLIYVGSTLLTPLYPIYRRQFHFSELVVTAIYAVYVVGNLAVLFFFGRVSDQIGRRAATPSRWRSPPRARCCSCSQATCPGCCRRAFSMDSLPAWARAP